MAVPPPDPTVDRPRPAPAHDGAPLHGGVLTVDLGAIRENYRRLSGRTGATVAGVVKADAYGLGAAEVAPALQREGCRTFFVAHLAEALALRPVLDQAAEIVVLNGLAPGSEGAFADAGLTPVLNSIGEIRAWAALGAERGGRLAAAIQVDSGMSRLGLPEVEMAMLEGEPALLAGIDTRLVMSHLACADQPDHPANAMQRDRFEALAKRLPRARLSLANSAGLFLDASFHGDLARPGIALYGGAPTSGRPNPMRATVRLQARVAQLRDVPAGAGIGYGFAHVAAAPMRLATISVGYADGWHRGIGEKGAAFRNGHRLPIVGRVSMDSIILDAGDPALRHLAAGDLVDLIGPDQSIDALAKAAGTIPYEILTSLGRRFERHYIGG